MSCEYEERIALYLYAGGDLDAAESAALDQHLAECRECSEVIRALESDGELLRSEPPELAEVNFAEMRREIVRRTRRPRLVPVMLAAAAILGAVAAGLVWRDYERPIPPLPVVVARLQPPPTPAPSAPALLRRQRKRPVPFPVPENAFRVPTHDPNVIIIWFAETKGDSNE